MLCAPYCGLYLHAKGMLVGKQFTPTGLDGCHASFSLDFYWHCPPPYDLTQSKAAIKLLHFLKLQNIFTSKRKTLNDTFNSFSCSLVCGVTQMYRWNYQKDIWERQTKSPTGSQKMKKETTLFGISSLEKNTFSFSFSQLMEYCESHDTNLIYLCISNICLFIFQYSSCGFIIVWNKR